MFRLGVAIRPDREPDMFGLVTAGRPQFLTVDDPIRTVALGPGPEARKICSGVPWRISAGPTMVSPTR
jgi:hypothetical protein